MKLIRIDTRIKTAPSPINGWIFKKLDKLFITTPDVNKTPIVFFAFSENFISGKIRATKIIRNEKQSAWVLVLASPFHQVHYCKNCGRSLLVAAAVMFANHSSCLNAPRNKPNALQMKIQINPKEIKNFLILSTT